MGKREEAEKMVAIASKQSNKEKETRKFKIKSVVTVVKKTDKNNNAKPLSKSPKKKVIGKAAQSDRRNVIKRNLFEEGEGNSKPRESDGVDIEVEVDMSEFDDQQLDYEEEIFPTEVEEEELIENAGEDQRPQSTDNEVFFNFPSSTANTDGDMMNMVEMMVNKKMEEERKIMRKQIEKEFEELSSRRSEIEENTAKPDKMGKQGTQYNVLKSPSDTTIYAPAFEKSPTQMSEKDQIINQISNFVDEIRIQHEVVATTSRGQDEQTEGYRETIQQQPNQLVRNEEQLERDSARKSADKYILEAEHFKANVEKPTGTSLGLSDDSFFHLLCHVDPNVVTKIENGEYVDLEKLLPPDRFGRVNQDDHHLEFRHVDGATYLAPAANSRERRITHVRKWEQAFRVYASIYCRANPLWTTEIWQYIEVINSAAAAYAWDNVLKYDYTFRQLMAYNPRRSWSSIYNHMWNLTMTEPLSKGHKYDRDGGNRAAGKRKSEGERDLSDYCWSFNRGHCKFGVRCDFINQCNYCDSTSHGRNACPKLQKKHGGGDNHEQHRSKHKDRKERNERNEKKEDK